MDFTNFALISFFCSRIPCRKPHYMQSSGLLSLLLSISVFSDFHCFCWPWQFGGLLVRDSTHCPSVLICLRYFSELEWGLGVGEGRPQTWGAIFNISYQGCIQSTWPVIDWNLNHPAETWTRWNDTTFYPYGRITSLANTPLTALSGQFSKHTTLSFPLVLCSCCYLGLGPTLTFALPIPIQFWTYLH